MIIAWDVCPLYTFLVHGIEYSRVCGRIVGYQIGTADAFHSQSEGIDSYYISGYSLTHGQPREHIWTFARAAAEEFPIDSHVCPCTQDTGGTEPSFIGEDYFCDTANKGSCQ